MVAVGGVVAQRMSPRTYLKHVTDSFCSVRIVNHKFMLAEKCEEFPRQQRSGKETAFGVVASVM